MATIEEVVEMWDNIHQNDPNAQTKPLKGKNVQPDGKISSGSSYGRRGKEAVIKLSDTHPFKPWPERTCYVFSFDSDKNNNLKSIKISFQRRTKEHPNTQAFYEFLKENFSEKFILSKGRINPNHLVLKKEFPLDSSAQNICKGMEELIKLTKKPICKFLKDKSNEKLLTKNQEKIFSEIMKKYKVKKDDNLYGKCKDIYNQTIKILKDLHIGSEDADEFLEVSYYTKKSIAQNLLITSKDKNKCDEFRLYYTYGMNDPSEGKTLLSFLGIENEDLELPEPLPFIACFSLEINSLNQFRLYGNEDNKEANGVSIVFDFGFFSDDINKKDGKYPLYHCVYIDLDKKMIESISFSKKDEKENQKEIEDRRKDIEDLFEELKNKTQELLKIDNKNISELAKDLLIDIRYLVKDCAFTEERECRIIDMRNKRNKRNKKDKPIKIDGERSYIEIGEVKNYISEVYFAPLAEGMEVFEAKTGIKCIRSRHPYKSRS